MKKTILLLCVLLLLLAFSACAHTHKWSDATCVTPVFCEGCGETVGEPVAHDWVEATCSKPKTCSFCGKTDGEAVGHNWLAASCTQPKTCLGCGITDGSVLEHSWVDATCLSAKVCASCEQIDGEALGHLVQDWETITEATCQAAGVVKGVCTRCQTDIEQETEMLSHTPGDWEINTQATLTTSGTRAKKCTGCNEIIVSESYELSEEEKEELYKESCKKYNYNDIARSPNKYKGEMAKFTGEVVQVQQETVYGIVFYVLRVNVTKKGSYYPYYTDTIYVTYFADEDDPRILEEDIITMYGTLEGEKTYTTVMGASVTIPAFSAEYIDIKQRYTPYQSALSSPIAVP